MTKNLTDIDLRYHTELAAATRNTIRLRPGNAAVDPEFDAGKPE